MVIADVGWNTHLCAVLARRDSPTDNATQPESTGDGHVTG